MQLNDIALLDACDKYGLVYPYREDLIEGASVDLRLGPEIFDMVAQEWKDGKVGITTHIMVPRNRLVIGVTAEKVSMPTHLVGHVWGKSSLARQGLVCVFTGLVQPGHDRPLVLEFLYHGPEPHLLLEVGQPVVQLEVDKLLGPSINYYKNQVPEGGIDYPTRDEEFYVQWMTNEQKERYRLLQATRLVNATGEGK